MNRTASGVVICLVLALASCTGSPPALVTQANELIDNWDGDREALTRADAMLDVALAANPRDVGALVAKARFYVSSGMQSTDIYDPENLKTARRVVEQALKIDPNSADARLQLGFILMHQLHLKEAGAELTKAEQLDPKNPLINIALEHLHALSNRWKEAADELSKAESKAADGSASPRVARRLVSAKIEVHRGLDDEDALARDYEESVRISPESAWVHGNYAHYLLTQRGMTDLAISEANKARAIRDYGGARQTLALAQYAKWAVLRRKDPTNAAKFYANARAMQPDLDRVMGVAMEAAERNRDLAKLVSALKKRRVSVDAPDAMGDTA
ncbi:MAG: tetratricopeptide repeat protein, partial [Thermomicrobiales bacterium]